MKIPKLIFIPGWGTDSSIFNAVLNRLKLQSTNIDWWNCLSNNADNNELYLELEASDDPAVIIGWSLGGIIALSAAIKYHKRISGLFLMSTTSRMIEDKGYYGVSENIIKAMIHKLKRTPIETLKGFFSLCTNDTDNAIPGMQDAALKIKKEDLLSGLLCLKNTDVRKDLGKIKLPVRIIHVEKDRVVSVKNGIYLSEKLPFSGIEILQEGEHLFFHEAPSFLVDEISKFIDKI